MIKFLPVFLILFTALLNAQNGETVLYFKSGDTVRGTGSLKGAKYINFKKENTSKKIKFSFDVLKKAEIKVNDTLTLTYRLFPIVKKNGSIKEPSVIGELVSGNVSLYIKGDLKNMDQVWNPVAIGGSPFMGTQAAPVHYFLRKHGEESAVHINSSYFQISKLLSNTGSVFSDCPQVYQYMLARAEHLKTINEAIEYYNSKCSN